MNNNHSKFNIYNLTNNNRSRLKKSKTHLFNTFSLFGKHLCNTFSLFGSAQQSINQVLLHTSLLLTLHCCIFLQDWNLLFHIWCMFSQVFDEKVKKCSKWLFLAYFQSRNVEQNGGLRHRQKNRHRSYSIRWTIYCNLFTKKLYTKRLLT